MNKAKQDGGWDVQAALQRVADAQGITLEQLEAHLHQLATAPTIEDKRRVERIREELEASPGWWGDEESF